MKDHRIIDERSLAFSRLVATKIRENPALIHRAEATLQRWLTTSSPRVRPALLEWQALLQGSREELLAMLVSSCEKATRLRQSSPFAGVLSPAERTAIIMEFQNRETPAA